MRSREAELTNQAPGADSHSAKQDQRVELSERGLKVEPEPRINAPRFKVVYINPVSRILRKRIRNRGTGEIGRDLSDTCQEI